MPKSEPIRSSWLPHLLIRRSCRCTYSTPKRESSAKHAFEETPGIDRYGAILQLLPPNCPVGSGMMARSRELRSRFSPVASRIATGLMSIPRPMDVSEIRGAERMISLCAFRSGYSKTVFNLRRRAPEVYSLRSTQRRGHEKRPAAIGGPDKIKARPRRVASSWGNFFQSNQARRRCRDVCIRVFGLGCGTYGIGSPAYG